MKVFFIEDADSGARSGATSAPLASSLPADSDILAAVASPEPGPSHVLIPSDENEQDKRTATAAVEGDPGRALMFRRYISQITARIQRAWIRPRSAIDSDLFACVARIVQDGSGRVIEIEIARCNGSTRWQTSLVAAIETASPLPAPPDPDVFSRTLSIEFTTEPFAPGKSAEGFEPESRTVMN